MKKQEKKENEKEGKVDISTFDVSFTIPRMRSEGSTTNQNKDVQKDKNVQGFIPQVSEFF